MMKDLKIFKLDLGWRGYIIVVAENSKDAVEKMSVCDNFVDRYGHLDKCDLEKFKVECLQIYEGLVICDTGDM